MLIRRGWLRVGGSLLLGAICLGVACAAPTAPTAPGVEPGLDQAVKWKWRIVPSNESDWGLAIPEPPPAPDTPAASPSNPSSTTHVAPNAYDVKKGDALVLIGKKFGLTVAQLKAANGLKDDRIRIGQTLKIPTPMECAALGLPVAAPTPKPTPRPKSAGAPATPTTTLDQEVLLLQVFLDRENFSAGPIDGKNSLDFQRVVYLYQSGHPDLGDTEMLRARALSGLGEPTTQYTLKHADFRWIAPPKAERAPETTPVGPAQKAKPGPAKPTQSPPPKYDEMVSAPMLAYRSPWEFVAERFHCREDLLRLLNPGIKTLPKAGDVLRVPNVVPFAIEKAFEPPLQPPADPANVVTASVVDLSWLEIYRNDRLVALLPLAPARPGLRGKGTWTILDPLPRPRLATRQELRDVPKPKDTFFTGEGSAPSPTPTVLATEQFLPAGPRNPVGILWIDLAKAGSPEPLAYGLHGTAIPAQMKSKSGLGGFRMANWDILRATRLLPKGTSLTWKQAAPPSPAKAPRPML